MVVTVDDNRCDIIITLRSRIGMIMEDAAPIAITMREASNPAELACRIAMLQSAARTLTILADAASALLGHEPADTDETV